MDRRAFLHRLGLAATVGLLAGCTDSADPGRVGERTTPAGGNDFPDGPKSPPDRPDPLTRESASAYAREYEHRYVYNRLWTDGADVDVSCEVESVEQYADVYRATVYCAGSSKTSGGTPEGGTGTTTLEYGHYGPTRTIYLVDEDTTLRLRPEDVTRPAESWPLAAWRNREERAVYANPAEANTGPSEHRERREHAARPGSVASEGFARR